MIVILLLILVATSIFYFLKWKYGYWDRMGVPGPKPTMLVGNLGENYIMKKSLLDVYNDIYREHKKNPFVGFYRTTTPTLLVCQPEVIKDMTVKSFQNFHDNDFIVHKDLDPILGRNPFCLKGEEWKIVRSQLTPGFTSGKMKSVYPLLEDVSKQMVRFIEKQPSATNGEGYETKELCSKFTLNNVANCAFGLDAKAFTEEDSDFKDIAKQFFSAGIFETLLFFVFLLIPPLTKLIRIKFVQKKTEDKLTNLVSQTLRYREENNIVRLDFLHILNQLKKTCKEYNFTDVDVTAHASGFFIDGYETSATVMSFILYQLAANPEVQSKLRDELINHFDETKESISYEALLSLPYLDAVISETLRMHPPLFALGKLCTKSYTYVPKEDCSIKKPVLIEKDTPVVIPLFALQNDPDYFKDPEVFDPERFIGTNKENIVKYTYMPFGEGPRACLGQRFGLLQIKTGIAHIIKNYRLSVNNKTKQPLQYDPLAFITTPKGGLWVDFEKN